MPGKHLEIAQANQDGWKACFKRSSMRVGFQVSLSKSMLEMLCAIADGVRWDRNLYPSLIVPDNWIAANCALLKRGLIIAKSDAEWEKEKAKLFARVNKGEGVPYDWNHYKLSPAGEHMVELIKMAGLFVEADAAIAKKSRRA